MGDRISFSSLNGTSPHRDTSEYVEAYIGIGNEVIDIGIEVPIGLHHLDVCTCFYLD
jgi:hypothetical protein